jgi:ATP-binding cassette subfamily B protein
LVGITVPPYLVWMFGRASRSLALGASSPESPAWPIFRRTLGLFQPFRGHIALVVVLIVLTATLSNLPFLVLQRIVDTATSETGDPEAITTLVLWMVAMYLASALLGIVRGYVNQLIGQGVMLNLRAALHDQLQRVAVRFYTETKTGEILSRVTADVNAVQDAVTSTFTMLLINVVTLGVALALMFSLDWRLASLVTLALPLWVYPTLRVGNTQRKLMLQWRDEAAAMAAHLAETLTVAGAMLVRSFGRQAHESARFSSSNRALRALSIRRFVAGRWFNTATELFGSLSIAFVYWYGARAVLTGDLPSVGVVVAFAGLASRVFAPFRQIARIQTTALASLALFERIFEYVELPVEVADKPGAHPLAHARGVLSLDDVSFSYEEGARRAVDRVSLVVQPGEMAALVGPSGAGKTTLTYLLQRFYDPTHGRILLDGHDLRDLTLSSIARAVGVVPQDTALFHISLADNIRYGKLDADDREVRGAAERAGLAALIDQLPRGLDTVVGERGYRLSGGEQQRVAIARAILKDPPVLLLDEATAALDSRLEREIREATLALARGRTTIVIAHRLSTVAAAHAIYVMDHGRVVESGRHEELVGRGGLYSVLHREQFVPEQPSELAPQPLA